MSQRRRERILVVDDEEHMLALFESVLGKEGYTVVCASSGKQALELLQQGEFDLVLSDLLMPGIDGLDMLHHVKTTYPTLPFVILTGHGTVRSAVAAMKDGAADYLTKPVPKRVKLSKGQQLLASVFLDLCSISNNDDKWHGHLAQILHALCFSIGSTL